MKRSKSRPRRSVSASAALLGALAISISAGVVAAPAQAGKSTKTVEYANGVTLRLLTPNPSLLIGEGEFYVTAVANIDANCLLKRQVTLFRNGAVIGSGNTKHYGNVTIVVGPPPPPGRYVVKMSKKTLPGKNHTVICGAAESKAVTVS